MMGLIENLIGYIGIFLFGVLCGVYIVEDFYK